MSAKVKEMQEIGNNLKIYRNMDKEELRTRTARHRAAFEKACQLQGHYLPSDAELDRWFTIK